MRECGTSLQVDELSFPLLIFPPLEIDHGILMEDLLTLSFHMDPTPEIISCSPYINSNMIVNTI